MQLQDLGYTLNGGSYFVNWDILMAWFSSEPYEVAIVGNEFEHLRREFKEHYLPIVFFPEGAVKVLCLYLKTNWLKGKLQFMCVSSKSVNFL